MLYKFNGIPRNLLNSTGFTKTMNSLLFRGNASQSKQMDCVLLLFRDTCDRFHENYKFHEIQHFAKNVTGSMQLQDLAKIINFHGNADFHDLWFQNH